MDNSMDDKPHLPPAYTEHDHQFPYHLTQQTERKPAHFWNGKEWVLVERRKSRFQPLLEVLSEGTSDPTLTRAGLELGRVFGFDNCQAMILGDREE
jgi:hypothetical protein